MKQITTYISSIVLIGLSVAACQNEDHLTPSGNGDVIEIKVKPEAAQTKTLVDVASDDVYAYTYGDDEASGTSALKQVSIENGVYSYSVPAGTEAIIFSNHIDSDDFAVTKTAEGGLQFTRKENESLYDTDIVAGVSVMDEVGSDGTLAPHLNRLNSFITADLQMKSMDGTELVLSDYMTYAYLRLPNQAGSVTYNADGTISVSETVFDGIIPEDPVTPDDPVVPDDPDNPGDDTPDYTENDKSAAMRDDNVIVNGNFESIDESDGFPAFWLNADDRSGLNSTDAYEGQYCLQIEQKATSGATGYSISAKQEYYFNVEAGKKYRFSICTKSPDGITDIKVSFHSTEYNSRIVKVSGSWQLYQTDIVIPEYNTSMYLAIEMGDQTGVCYIDNVQMYPVEEEPFNHFTNGSFEEVTDGLPDGWTIISGAEFISIDDSISREGSRSLRMNATYDPENPVRIASPLIDIDEDVNYEYISNCINLDNETYTVTYSKLYGVSNVWEDGATIQDSPAGTGNSWNSFSRHDIDGNIHGPYYYIIESDPYHSVCLDNFRVYDMNTRILPLSEKASDEESDEDSYIDPTSILINGGFESCTSDGSMPDGWRTWEGNPAIETVETHSGSYAIRLEGSGNAQWHGITSDEVYIEQGTTYRFGAWVKTDIAGQSFWFNMNSSQYYSVALEAGEWAYVYTDYYAESSRYVTLDLDANISTGRIYIDDVEFYPLSIDTPQPSSVMYVYLPTSYGYTEMYCWGEDNTEHSGEWPGISYIGIGEMDGVDYNVWEMSLDHGYAGSNAQFIFSYDNGDGTRTQTADSEVYTLYSIMMFDMTVNMYGKHVPYLAAISGETEFSARAMASRTLDENQTSYRLADEMATLPTATGKNSRLELVIGNKSGTEMTLAKELDYPFEPNRHYTFTLVVKRNETGFGFQIEDIIEEEINIDLN